MQPPDERASTEIVGRVETQFVSFQPVHIISKESISKKVYAKLMEEARKKYQGNIEVVNITSEGSFTPIEIPFIYPFFIFGNFQKITATGDVILFGRGGAASIGIEGALERAVSEVSENFNARSRLAIVYITAEDRSQTDFIAGELEHILRRKGFVIIDRSELDRIRAEQRFGTSGEVDDRTAARIGNIAGASVVITGRVDGEGNLRRLRLRALNTDNGQVVGTASERL
jgi:hypothetical protein